MGGRGVEKPAFVPWASHPVRPLVWGVAIATAIRVVAAFGGPAPWWNLVGLLVLLTGAAVTLHKFPSIRTQGAAGWVSVVGILALACAGALWLASRW